MRAETVLPPAVLLEFEGVLCDTRGARRAALQRALGDEGHSVLDPTRLDAAARLPLPQAVRAAFALVDAYADETTFALGELRAERVFSEHVARGLPLVDGAAEFLEAAQGTTRLALVTRASRREVEFILALAGIADLFEVVVTSSERLPGKPDAAPYQHALERLAARGRVPSGQCVALEDAAPGIRAAHATGLPVIAVGPLPPHEALDADAHLPSLRGADLGTLTQLLTRDSPERR